MTICAERNAAAAMVLAGGRRIRFVAVVSPEASPAFPCGACRQVLHEFGCEEVVVRDASGVRRYPFEDILPHAFGPERLVSGNSRGLRPGRRFKERLCGRGRSA